MLGKFWQIDEDISDEFLEMLPPIYAAGGFSMCERLAGDTTATFQRIGGQYWCSYANRTTTTPEANQGTAHNSKFMCNSLGTT